MTKRPNILYLFTDQQHAGVMSCAGSLDVSTPAMDSIAAQGLRFNRAYCTHPICTPSRASMWTGRYPHEVGVDANGQGIDERFRSMELGTLFSAAGYDCVYGGKWHVPTGHRIDDGHGFRCLAPMGDPGLTDACVEYLRQAPDDKPFLLVASFDNPHNICEYARNQGLPWGPVPDPALADCPTLPPNHGIPPFEPQALRVYQSFGPQWYPMKDASPEEWRRYRHAYCRMVERVDAQIGRVLEALREAGLEENTLVVFSSDHGDGYGEHQWNQKSVLYEASVRIPLLVQWKGTLPAGGVSDALVSNGLDLLPTLCDLGDVAAPDDLAGRSLRPLLESGTPAGWRDHLVVETLLDHSRGTSFETHGRAVVSQRYKYALYNWGRNREQLFDLDSDPGEMSTLADSRRHAETLEHHRRLLLDWCAATGDRFANARFQPGGPYVSAGC